MRINHIWSIACRESIVNQDDNVISLVGVLEDINSVITPINPTSPKPDLINIPFNFHVVNYWIKDKPEEVKMQVKTTLIDPNGKQLSEAVNDLVFPLNSQKLRSRMKVQGFPVTTSGEYHLTVNLKIEGEKVFKRVTELPLNINIKFDEKKPSAD